MLPDRPPSATSAPRLLRKRTGHSATNEQERVVLLTEQLRQGGRHDFATPLSTPTPSSRPSITTTRSTRRRLPSRCSTRPRRPTVPRSTTTPAPTARTPGADRPYVAPQYTASGGSGYYPPAYGYPTPPVPAPKQHRSLRVSMALLLVGAGVAAGAVAGRLSDDGFGSTAKASTQVDSGTSAGAAGGTTTGGTTGGTTTGGGTAGGTTGGTTSGGTTPPAPTGCRASARPISMM